jgi:hypothetical protein
MGNFVCALIRDGVGEQGKQEIVHLACCPVELRERPSFEFTFPSGFDWISRQYSLTLDFEDEMSFFLFVILEPFLFGFQRSWIRLETNY